VRYAIKFVADMEKAVKFYRDVVGLQLKFESPGWSEFVTGNHSRTAPGFGEESSRTRRNWASPSPMSRLSTGR
jgi:catechol 2,3-dioxygenase-like lactoylglutathione lyase family enzyme